MTTIHYSMAIAIKLPEGTRDTQVAVDTVKALEVSIHKSFDDIELWNGAHVSCGEIELAE